MRRGGGGNGKGSCQRGGDELGLVLGWETRTIGISTVLAPGGLPGGVASGAVSGWRGPLPGDMGPRLRNYRYRTGIRGSSCRLSQRIGCLCLHGQRCQILSPCDAPFLPSTRTSI